MNNTRLNLRKTYLITGPVNIPNFEDGDYGAGMPLYFQFTSVMPAWAVGKIRLVLVWFFRIAFNLV
jgi:hypothetical protein